MIKRGLVISVLSFGLVVPGVALAAPSAVAGDSGAHTYAVASADAGGSLIYIADNTKRSPKKPGEQGKPHGKKPQGKKPQGKPGDGGKAPHGRPAQGKPGDHAQPPHGQPPQGRPGDGEQPPQGQAPQGQPPQPGDGAPAPR